MSTQRRFQGWMVGVGTVAALLLLATCRNPLELPTGSLSISVVDSINARTLLPALSMQPSSYTVSGVGPGGATFTQSTPSGSLSIDSLAFGSWTVTVQAYNGDGMLIGSGQGTAVVHTGQSTPLSVTVRPLSGSGTLALTVSWNSSQVDGPSILASLLDSSGNTTPLSFSVSGSQGSYSSSVATGYQTLSLQVLDNGVSVMGAVEVVRIVKDQTTSGAFTFDNVNAPGGSIQVNIDPQMADPLPLEISGVGGTLGAGSTVTATARVSDGTVGVSYVWYLNGRSVGTGSSLSFGSALAVGYYRLDATGFSADGSRAGSASVSFRVTSGGTGGLTEIYVRPDGNDADPGSAASPKLTIQAGVAAAAAAGLSEVRVAEGTYSVSSPIALSSGMTISGGYSTDWSVRDPTAHVSTIRDSRTAGSQLRVVSASGGVTATLSGLTILGAASGTDTSAVWIDSSNVTITDCHLNGGSATTGASAGVQYSQTDSPSNRTLTIQNSVIQGGGGIFSYGIRLYFGPGSLILNAAIRHNTISAGSAATTVNGTGIYLDDANAATDTPAVEISYNHVSVTTVSNEAVGMEIRSRAFIYNNVVLAGAPSAPVPAAVGVIVSYPSPGTGLYTKLYSDTIVVAGAALDAVGVVIQHGDPEIEHDIIAVSGGPAPRYAVEETYPDSDPHTLRVNDFYTGQPTVYVDYDGLVPTNGDGDGNAHTAGISDLQNMTDLGSTATRNIGNDPVLDGSGDLTAASPTFVTQGGYSFLNQHYPYSDDVTGAPRTDPWSLGAYER